jgi:hypothetical protein
LVLPGPRVDDAPFHDRLQSKAEVSSRGANWFLQSKGRYVAVTGLKRSFSRRRLPGGHHSSG